MIRSLVANRLSVGPEYQETTSIRDMARRERLKCTTMDDQAKTAARDAVCSAGNIRRDLALCCSMQTVSNHLKNRISADSLGHIHSICQIPVPLVMLGKPCTETSPSHIRNRNIVITQAVTAGSDCALQTTQ
ncbi:uncharacterized protein LOC119578826 [Penaeus monodon]|uniref:uncharacterized protein LOC119578826 n=1 Tax=Penaeus monodon TaxID=6687 RepID=UPI0018A764A7|nr:uncharacterized protein LOC119578826 [Penaeus monodon]